MGPGPLDLGTRVGTTPLAVASTRGRRGAGAAAAGARASLDAPAANGWTPLHTAARTGHLVLARVLTDAGAGLYSPTHAGDTPKAVAIMPGHYATVQLLQLLAEQRWTPGRRRAFGARTAVLCEHRCPRAAADADVLPPELWHRVFGFLCRRHFSPF